MPCPKIAFLVCLTLLFAAGCASTPPPAAENTPQTTASSCAAEGDSVWDTLRSAWCSVVEAVSRQTKSSSEVEGQYKTGNNNQLPMSLP
jgi:hypothetical protein